MVKRFPEGKRIFAGKCLNFGQIFAPLAVSPLPPLDGDKGL